MFQKENNNNNAAERSDGVKLTFYCLSIFLFVKDKRDVSDAGMSTGGGGGLKEGQWSRLETVDSVEDGAALKIVLGKNVCIVKGRSLDGNALHFITFQCTNNYKCSHLHKQPVI